MQLSDIAVIVTAWRRPAYLERTLDSWSRVRGVRGIGCFHIALGRGDRELDQSGVIKAAAMKMGCRVNVIIDSPAAQAAPGMHRAVGEAGDCVFGGVPVSMLLDEQGDLLGSSQTLPRPRFTVFSEEDIVVSDDVLEFMLWAARRFEEDRQVLAVCAHDAGGQGWDEPGAGTLPGRRDARQDAVMLRPYFNPWCWGTWPDRWHETLAPAWDWDATTGSHPMRRGYDWNIHDRVIPATRSLCVVPDASRSQNIGRDGGFYARPDLFEGTQSASFRGSRPATEYRLVSEEKGTR